MGIDLYGEFPIGESVLVVTFHYLQWAEVVILKSTTTTVVKNHLRIIFACGVLPIRIMTDNGRQFCGAEFNDFVTKQAIEHHRETPHWLHSNSQVECANHCLPNATSTAHAENKDWRKELLTYLLACRSTPHAVTGKTPSQLLYGRSLRTKMPEMSAHAAHHEVQERDKIQKVEVGGVRRQTT